MKYYYTDPLAAAWMAKHFGMRFCAHDGEHIEIKQDGFRGTCEGEEWDRWLRSERSSPYEYKKLAYIHPDSLHLLEPKVGDLVELSFDTQRGVVSTHQRYTEEQAKEHIAGVHSWKRYKSIQRNGLAFMWPEVE
jgi:hypothetical protein